jgi:hypothetical protein
MLIARDMMFRSTALLLVLCLGWMLFGVQFKFISDQNAIRKEIKKRIKQGVPESELFVFNLTEISREPGFSRVNDHEFRRGDQLFDIVRTNGNKVFCINDTQEEKLFSKLDELTQKASGSRGVIKKTISIQLSCYQNETWAFFLSSDPYLTVSRIIAPCTGYLSSPFEPPCC